MKHQCWNSIMFFPQYVVHAFKNLECKLMYIIQFHHILLFFAIFHSSSQIFKIFTKRSSKHIFNIMLNYFIPGYLGSQMSSSLPVSRQIIARRRDASHRSLIHCF